MTTQTRSKTKTDSPTFTESAQIGNKHSLKKMKHTSRYVYQRFRLIGHAKYAVRLDNYFSIPKKFYDVRVALDTDKFGTH